MIHTIVCARCERRKRVNVYSGNPYPLLCKECDLEEKAKKKREYLLELTKLPIKERLARIEEFFYDEPWAKSKLIKTRERRSL